MDRRVIIGIATLLLLIGLGWWFMPSSTTASMAVPSAQAPKSPPARLYTPRHERVEVVAAPPEQPAEDLDQDMVATLFPGTHQATCAAPEDVPSGRHNGGEAQVIVRGGQTTVISPSAQGTAPVRLLGRSLGNIQWANGTCDWPEEQFVTLTGQVAGGGVHQVAGCPIGDVVLTSEAGQFSVQVPEGQACTARAVRIDEQGRPVMGSKHNFTATTDGSLTLQPADGPGLTDAEFNMAVSMMQRLTRGMLNEAQGELERLSSAGGTHEDAAWFIAQASDQVDFFEAELARLQTDAGAAEAVADLVFSQSN